jgi:hypothetical protein
LPPLLADLNIAVPVVAFLRGGGADVASLYEGGLAHLDAEAILAALQLCVGARAVWQQGRDRVGLGLAYGTLL